MPCKIRTLYEEKLERWIQDGWLIPYVEGKYKPSKGLVPLIAIVQQSKGKVWPVMDLGELNIHINTITADSDV